MVLTAPSQCQVQLYQQCMGQSLISIETVSLPCQWQDPPVCMGQEGCMCYGGDI